MIAKSFRTVAAAAFGANNLSAFAQAQQAIQHITFILEKPSFKSQMAVFYHSQLGIIMNNIPQTRNEFLPESWNQHQDDSYRPTPTFRRTKYRLVKAHHSQNPIDSNEEGSNSPNGQVYAGNRVNNNSHSISLLSSQQIFNLLVGTLTIMDYFGLTPEYIGHAIIHLYQYLNTYFAAHN